MDMRRYIFLGDLKRRIESFDCVLLDLVMPGMDGEATFDELRRLDPEVKVIIITGYDEQEVSRRFLDKGLAGFLQKPFQGLQLLHALERVLRKNR